MIFLLGPVNTHLLAFLSPLFAAGIGPPFMILLQNWTHFLSAILIVAGVAIYYKGRKGANSGNHACPSASNSNRSSGADKV